MFCPPPALKLHPWSLWLCTIAVWPWLFTQEMKISVYGVFVVDLATEEWLATILLPFLSTGPPFIMLCFNAALLVLMDPIKNKTINAPLVFIIFPTFIFVLAKSPWHAKQSSWTRLATGQFGQFEEKVHRKDQFASSYSCQVPNVTFPVSLYYFILTKRRTIGMCLLLHPPKRIDSN